MQTDVVRTIITHVTIVLCQVLGKKHFNFAGNLNNERAGKLGVKHIVNTYNHRSVHRLGLDLVRILSLSHTEK